jgi:hydrogenase large subunit
VSEVRVGPFNRVEGDLQLRLEVEDGIVREARVETTLYRGFEQLLLTRPPLDALVVAPRICGICSLSQSLAAAAALRALSGGAVADNGALAANIAHAAENIADHLTHFYLFFMPDFARDEYAGRPSFEAVARRFKAVQGEAQREVLPARRRLLETMGALAGKWPHSLSFQPGGSTRALGLSDRVRLIALVAEFEAFVEATLFGAPLDEVIAWETLDELAAFGERGQGDAAAFVRLAAALRLDRVGRGPGPLMSFGAYDGPEGPLFPAGVLVDGVAAAVEPGEIVEHVASSWLAGEALPPGEGRTEPSADKASGYSWAKAPRYAGRPAEVGAFARQAVAGHPLALAMLAADGGSSVRGRVVARLLEVALLTRAMGLWLRRLDLKAPFLTPLALPREGVGVGRVEAARGALGHWLSVRDGEIAGYQIIAPTTWNFSPRDGAGVPGPLEGALVGVEVGRRGAKAASVQHVVRSFDPCMVCTAH